MIIKLKATVEILEEIPYILLIPRYQFTDNHYLHDLNLFLQQEFNIETIGLQTPFNFQVEEQTFIIGLKRKLYDDRFCALKILFKSFFDGDINYKLDVLFSLQKKYSLDIFDGKDHRELMLSPFELKAHIKSIQKNKKDEWLSSLTNIHMLT